MSVCVTICRVFVQITCRALIIRGSMYTCLRRLALHTDMLEYTVGRTLRDLIVCVNIPDLTFMQEYDTKLVIDNAIVDSRRRSCMFAFSCKRKLPRWKEGVVLIVYRSGVSSFVDRC